MVNWNETTKRKSYVYLFQAFEANLLADGELSFEWSGVFRVSAALRKTNLYETWEERPKISGCRGP